MSIEREKKFEIAGAVLGLTQHSTLFFSTNFTLHHFSE
jgi:hypothetical protein